MTLLSGRAQRRAVDLFLPVSREVAVRCGLAGRSGAYELMPNFLIDEPRLAAGDDQQLERLPTGPFILYAGDVATDKGVGVLLEAHAQMRTRTPLVLAGRPVEPELARERPGVIVLGRLTHDAVLAAWQRCTVAAVPSITPETFGLVALEAMAAGVPVVASRVGGLPEVVVDGESGLLVAPADPSQLAEALDRLIADSTLRERLGAGGRRRAAEFSAAAVVPRVEAAYERALAIRERARAA